MADSAFVAFNYSEEEDNAGNESDVSETNSDYLDDLLEKAKAAARAISKQQDALIAQASTVHFESENTSSRTGGRPTKRPRIAFEDVTQQPEKEEAPVELNAGVEGKVRMDKWGKLPERHLSKRERKQAQPRTAGPQWFDMPAPTPTPELRREVQAMRLHGVLDPKRFLKGEAKRERNKMPEFFQFGHILNTPHPASTSANAGASTRKKSFLDELLDDSEARSRTKKQFADVQARSTSGGKSFYRDLKARRRGRGGQAVTPNFRKRS